jgi:hypothetical protein
MKFEITNRAYSIEIAETAFIDLLDSESYVTGSAALSPGMTTLGDKLDRLPGVTDTEYDGHFGAAIYVRIDAEDDGPELHRLIETIITDHLAWCKGLKKKRR